MDRTSTVDMILGSETMREKLVCCRAHSSDHGSDYKPIEIEVDVDPAEGAVGQGKRLYKDAD